MEIKSEMSAVVTDGMLRAYITSTKGPMVLTDEEIREGIRAAIIAGQTGEAEVLHDLSSGEPDVRPQGDEELQNFTKIVVDFLRQSLLQSKAPGPEICASIVDLGTRLLESRKSMYIPYSDMVKNLFKEMGSPAATLIHAGVGISGEAGELLDALKKHWVYEKPLDVPNVLEEMGDIMFYFTYLMITFGWTISDIQMANRMKLAKRYPDGVYTNKHAQERLDKVEHEKVVLDEDYKIELKSKSPDAFEKNFTGDFKPF